MKNYDRFTLVMFIVGWGAAFFSVFLVATVVLYFILSLPGMPR